MTNSILSLILSIILIIQTAHINSFDTSSKRIFPTDTEVGIWMWESPTYYINNPNWLNKQFLDLSNLGINAVYVRVDDYVDISEIKSVSERTAKLADFDKNLQNFVLIASSYGLSTYGVAGNTDWSQTELSYIPVAITKHLLEYNDNNQTQGKVKGLHFDIESYSSPDFNINSNQERILNEYVNMTKAIVDEVKKTNSDFHLGITVPYWLDNTTRKIPNITYNDKTKPVVFHLIDTLNNLPNSQLIVMAYRNFASGANGAVDLVKEEIDYANKSNVKIIIAQETLKYQTDEHSTFFGKGISKLSQEVAVIDKTYAEQKSYGGIAIHHLNSFLELEKDKP